MFENKAEAIGNALTILKGSYVFYRDLGTNWVDKSDVPARKDITVLLAKYYPDVKVQSIERLPVESAQDEQKTLLGQRYYKVNLGD